MPMRNASRQRVYEILSLARPGDRVSRWADIVIIGLIAANVVALILESVNSLYVPYVRYFAWFEAVSVALFTVEYVSRIWSVTEHPDGRYRDPVRGRLRYLVTPMALVDLAAILPFYLSMFIPIDLRFLRALRLMRVFKLTRYSASMNMLLTVFREEARAFGAAFFILVVMLVLTSSGIYLFERQAQPETFGSIPAAMWWAVATLTTVGYGDMIPITTGGKIFGIGVMIIGIGMVALPAGILASAFSDHYRQRRADYHDLVDAVLKDGVITTEEKTVLEQTRRELGLTDEEAEKMLARVTRGSLSHKVVCPHCEKLFYPVTDRVSNE